MKIRSKIKLVLAMMGAKFSSNYFRTPLSVGWAITHKCNLRCTHCTLSGRDFKGEDVITTEAARKLIKEMAKAKVEVVTLTGGEVLLRDDIDIIIRDLHAHKIKVSLNTNGLLVNKHQDLLSYVHVVSLSLDGTKKIHDSIRGPGSFDRVMSSLELLRSKKINCSVMCVVSPKNYECLEELCNLAHEKKFVIGFQPEWDERPSFISSEDFYNEYMAIFRKLKILKNKFPRLILNSLSGISYLQTWPRQKPLFCASSFISCRIYPNGDLHPCGRVKGRNEIAPNCLKLGFAQAFKEMTPFYCRQCSCMRRLEQNLAFSLNLNSLINFAHSIW